MQVGTTVTLQATFLGIPLFFCDGEECYSLLNATMKRMLREGHLFARI
jgi:hypothetical protein